MVDKGKPGHDGPDHVRKNWDYGKARGAVLYFWIVGSGSCQIPQVPRLTSNGMKMAGAM